MLTDTRGQKSVQFHFYQFKKNHAPQLFLTTTPNRNIIRKYKGDPEGTGKLIAA